MCHIRRSQLRTRTFTRQPVFVCTSKCAKQGFIMNIERTPPGHGIYDTRLGGSQPNLSHVSLEEDIGIPQITIRNKRKHDDDTSIIKSELSDLKKQMADMMALLTATSNLQKENIDRLCHDVATIKDDVHGFSKTIEHIIKEQETLKSDMANLKITNNNFTERFEALHCEINSIQNHLKPSASLTNDREELMSEINERNLRAKNIIIVGIPEAASSAVAERLEHDKKEVLKIIAAIHTTYPEPERILRLGKFKAGVTRPLKVCFQADKTAKMVLRNKKNLKLDNIKIYSDQTISQRKYLEHLKKELQSRIANGETDLQIKYIKDVPKIIKTEENINTNDTKNPKPAKFH